MNVLTVCPGVQALREFARGRLPEPRAGELREHLSVCPRCRGIVEGIDATEKDSRPGETGWTETAMSTTVPGGETVTIDYSGPTPPGRSGSVASTQRAEEDDEPDDELDLSFLLPSQRPNALGRIGDYEILNILGRGGMGVVFKAYDTALHRIVAIKVLAPGLATSRRARKQFTHEARSAAAIRHPSVVTIHAVGTQGETPYLVMECIGGQSLRHRIRESGKGLSTVEILRIGLQVAEGLAAAHAQGVIHRDIKPANIMLEDGLERVKITDFGLALAAMNLSEMTSLDKVVGTPAYMSPEQVRGEPLDARSDLFSLGTALYAMVAGHSPFRGPHTLETIRRVCELDPPAPSKLDAAIPGPLSDLIMRLLSKAPEDRPASAAAVAEELRGLLVSENLEPVRGMVDPELAGASARTARPPRRRERPAFGGAAATIVAVALLIAAVAVAAYLLRPGPAGRAVADGPPAASVLPAVTLVVGPGPGADYRTVAEALEHAGPGSTIRLQAGNHDGRILIQDPGRWRGLTVEPLGYGAPGAARVALTWVEGTMKAVVELRNNPGVTVRGVTIESIDYQHGVFIGNNAEGVTIEDVRFRKPAGKVWSHMKISEGARGSNGGPIRLRNSTFELGGMGLVVGDESGSVVSSIRIEGNRFLGGGAPHLMLTHNLRDVQAAGNVFVGGRAIVLDLHPGQAERMILANNTFFDCAMWLGAGSSDAERARVEVVNSAIIGTDALDPDGSLARLAGAGWRFAHNVWESGAGRDNPLADPNGRIEVLSRDPASPDFLRPAPGSRLIGAGAGGELPDYIGALPPRDGG